MSEWLYTRCGVHWSTLKEDLTYIRHVTCLSSYTVKGHFLDCAHVFKASSLVLASFGQLLWKCWLKVPRISRLLVFYSLLRECFCCNRPVTLIALFHLKSLGPVNLVLFLSKGKQHPLFAIERERLGKYENLGARTIPN